MENADGFAEVFPEHKYQVVKMLQSRGHLTAMTGDGAHNRLEIQVIIIILVRC